MINALEAALSDAQSHSGAQSERSLQVAHGHVTKLRAEALASVEAAHGANHGAERDLLLERAAKLTNAADDGQHRIGHIRLSLRTRMGRQREADRLALLGGDGSYRGGDADNKEGSAEKDEIVEQARTKGNIMKRVRGLLQVQVARMKDTRDAMREENDQVRGLTKRMDDLTSSVHSAKGALRALQLSERKDKLMVYASVGFFAFVVLYIFLRRTGVLRFVAAVFSGLIGLSGSDGNGGDTSTHLHTGHDEL